jgi:hypothetical protein
MKPPGPNWNNRVDHPLAHVKAPDLHPGLLLYA